MGDVDHRALQALVENCQFRAHGRPELGVQVRQGLVEEETVGIAHDGPSHGHALALPPGEVLGPAVQIVGELKHLRRLANPPGHLLLRASGEPEGKGHVSGDIHVGVERVGLEHHRDVPLLGRCPGNVLVADEYLAARDRLQAGDHPEGGRFAASGRSDDDNEFAFVEMQIHHRNDIRGPERLGDTGKTNAVHAVGSPHFLSSGIHHSTTCPPRRNLIRRMISRSRCSLNASASLCVQS